MVRKVLFEPGDVVRSFTGHRGLVVIKGGRNDKGKIKARVTPYLFEKVALLSIC